jgi:hypothetical protein
MKTRLAWFLVVAFAACGGGGGEDGDEYSEAVPDMDQLALELGEDGAVSGALSAEEGAVIGDPAQMRALAQKVADGLNGLLGDTHAGVKALMQNGASATFKVGALQCRVWEGLGADGVYWKLLGCLKDRNQKHYAVLLRGRAATAMDDAAFVPVFAADVKLLPRHEEKRRGFGWIGYDFDNLAALTGKDFAGRLGIGFHAAGRARQMRIGLDGVKTPGMADAQSGVFKYVRVIGHGGRFAFITRADVVAKDATDKLTAGQDGVNEAIRAAFAWRADQRFRTVVAACDGTLGAKVCIRVAQCWAADQKVTFESFLDETQPIAWDETKCGPATPFPPEELPGADDEKPPKPKKGSDLDGGAGFEAPEADTPPALPDLE